MCGADRAPSAARRARYVCELVALSPRVCFNVEIKERGHPDLPEALWEFVQQHEIADRLLSSLPAEVTDGIYAISPSPSVDSAAYKRLAKALGVEEVDPYSAQCHDHASLVCLAVGAKLVVSRQYPGGFLDPALGFIGVGAHDTGRTARSGPGPGRPRSPRAGGRR